MKTKTELKTIHMVDLVSQYHRLKPELDLAMGAVINNAAFINGPELTRFAGELEVYLGVKHVIPCANGTDALQIALMALDLPEGSEVITPGFAYAAVAEVCCLLKLKPVFADVDINTFNINPLEIEKHISSKTKVIIPVHLFGQCSDMETIMAIAEKHNLTVIEDNAQSIGADYTFSDGKTVKAGVIGHISTTSFFPSKNLGCYGDGGAIFCNDDKLFEKMKMIANHGQKQKYQHDIVGVNSRLDTLQAAILSVKLKYLNDFIAERQRVAESYDAAFSGIEGIRIPVREKKSSHTFHQYTLQLYGYDIEKLRADLKSQGIPSMVYYPMPVHKQKAFYSAVNLPVSESLCNSVLSLPIGTDMETSQIEFITTKFKENISNQ